jgi:uncharacterized coiled-coil protein SlyX
MTTPSISQTATNDTIDLNSELVCIPKSIMDSVIADLKSGDIAKEEVDVLNEQMKLRTTYEENLEEVITNQKKAIAHCNDAITETSNLADQYKLRLDKVDRELTHKKKWVTILSVISITSIFLNIAHL